MCFITPFDFNERLKQLIPDLAKYVLGLPGLINPNQSLCILGNTGTGKTMLLRAVSNVYRRIRDYIFRELKYLSEAEKHPLYGKTFQLVTAETLITGFSDEKKGGVKFLQPYALTYKKPSELNHLCIDEIGDKKDYARHYASEINPIEYMIKKRNEGFTATRGKLKTHFTTNLNLEKLKEIMEARAFSRLCEMCYFIEITGKDYRK